MVDSSTTGPMLVAIKRHFHADGARVGAMVDEDWVFHKDDFPVTGETSARPQAASRSD